MAARNTLGQTFSHDGDRHHQPLAEKRRRRRHQRRHYCGSRNRQGQHATRVFEDGKLLKIVAPAGATVKLDDLVAVIGQPGEDISAILAGAPEAAAAPRAKTGTAVLEPDEGPAPPPNLRNASRPVRWRRSWHRSAALTCALCSLQAGRRVIQRDVPAEPVPAAQVPAAALPAAAGGIDIPLSNLRQTIARRLSQSKQSIPHWYLYSEILMDRAMQFREELNASLAAGAAKISVTDLIIKVVAVALARHPEMIPVLAKARYTDTGPSASP